MQALAESVPGVNCRALADSRGFGESTVYEIVRALRDGGALDPPNAGQYRLSNAGVGGALRNLLNALNDLDHVPVSKPPRPKAAQARLHSPGAP